MADNGIWKKTKKLPYNHAIAACSVVMDSISS